jgi:hypothetical protein
MVNSLLHITQDMSILYETSGIRTITFYMKDNTISPKNVLNFDSTVKHLGIIDNLNENLIIGAMFTSKPVMYLADKEILSNILLTNNTSHLFINQIFIINKQIFETYFSTTHEISQLPNRCKNYNKINLYNDSINGFNEALNTLDFSNPSIMEDVSQLRINFIEIDNNTNILKLNKPKTNIDEITFTNKTEYLKELGVRYEDLEKFINKRLNIK